MAYTWKWVLALGLGLASTTLAAQQYPARSINLIVPFGPGGINDIGARLVADRLGQKLKQPVVVENRPGAAGNIGVAYAARAKPDGYTLLLGNDGPLAINPHIYSQLPFNTLRDFDPITNLGDADMVILASPALQSLTMRDVLAKAKNKPFTYGSAGTGSSTHLLGEVIAQRASIQLTHVPYKGGSAAIADLLGSHIDLVMTTVPSAMPYLHEGKIRALAVASAARNPSLPDVPTLIESGIKDLVVTSWVGILAPTGTPRATIDLLNQKLVEILADEDLKKRFAELGIKTVGNTPAQFRAQIQDDLERLGQVVKQANVRVE